MSTKVYGYRLDNDKINQCAAFFPICRGTGKFSDNFEIQALLTVDEHVPRSRR